MCTMMNYAPMYQTACPCAPCVMCLQRAVCMSDYGSTRYSVELLPALTTASKAGAHGVWGKPVVCTCAGAHAPCTSCRSVRSWLFRAQAFCEQPKAPFTALPLTGLLQHRPQGAVQCPRVVQKVL